MVNFIWLIFLWDIHGHIHGWLVVFLNPSEKYFCSSIGMMRNSQLISGKMCQMPKKSWQPVTTNQFMMTFYDIFMGYSWTFFKGSHVLRDPHFHSTWLRNPWGPTGCPDWLRRAAQGPGEFEILGLYMGCICI